MWYEISLDIFFLGMANEQEFFLRWNNHQSNLITAFHDLRIGEDFVDVTLACEGQSLQAHKVESKVLFYSFFLVQIWFFSPII